MATGGKSMSLKCKKIIIVLKHFAKRLTNEYLSLLHEHYTLHKVVDFIKYSMLSTTRDRFVWKY